MRREAEGEMGGGGGEEGGRGRGEGGEQREGRGGAEGEVRGAEGGEREGRGQRNRGGGDEKRRGGVYRYMFPITCCMHNQLLRVAQFEAQLSPEAPELANQYQ